MKIRILFPLAFSAFALAACGDLEIFNNDDIEEPPPPTAADRLKPIFSASPDAEPDTLADMNLLASDIDAVFGPADGEPVDVSSEGDADDVLTLVRR